VAANLAAITNRLAANIYAADMDQRAGQIVLWDMIGPAKQKWYIKQATKVLRYAASRTEPSRRFSKTRPSSAD
jgi:hypothetical protein